MQRDPWRDSCPDIPDLLSSFSRPKLSARLCSFGLKIQMRRNTWRDSCPHFPDFMSRLSRMKLSARSSNLVVNPIEAPPLALLMSRHSRPYVQNFQTESLGASMQFRSKSECGAILGATRVQTFQTLGADLSRLRLLTRICIFWF